MDLSIINEDLLNQLIHERNLILVQHISDLSIKDKRKLFSLLRKVSNKHHNFMFPQFFGATIGEFCTVQVLLNDSKRKFKEYLNKQCADMNLGIFEEKKFNCL
jgi:hypothetical protein